MYRNKDFFLMEVKNIKGKIIGNIKDLAINFNEKILEGFILNKSGVLIKENFIKFSDVLSFNVEDGTMIVRKVSKMEGIPLSKVINVDVIDKEGNILGMTQEILLEEKSLELKGAIISSGIIRDFLYGRRILLCKELILGEESILYFGSTSHISFSTIAHHIEGESKENEYVTKFKKS